MNMLCNRVLYANQFVEYATGNCYYHCDTLREMSLCFWNGTGEPISKIWNLIDINKVPTNAYVCLVQVSNDDDYTEHEVKIVRIKKSMVNKFIKNMKEGI